MIQEISNIIHKGLPITYIRNNNELNLRMLKEWGLEFNFGDKFSLTELNEKQLEKVLIECKNKENEIYKQNIKLVLDSYQKQEIKPQNIVDSLNGIELKKSRLNLQLLNKKEELRKLDLFQEIQELELNLKELEREDTEIREQGKQLLYNAGLKKFEALDGTIIQLNETPGALLIDNEDLIPQEYKKEKVTISIDKKTLKEDIKQGLIIDGVTIEKDYKLVIKNPK